MATYKPLQSIALTADTSSVTFSGIPQDYTDLVLVFNGSVSASEDFQIQVNSDTNSNYSRTVLTGNGTSATSNRSSTQTYMRFTQNGYLTTGNSNIIAHFINYSNTTTNKTALSRSNNAATGVDSIVNLWRSTAAITSIYCYLPSGNFAAGCTFDLYGIKSGAPQALGGDLVTTDGNYWYHTFRSTQAFTPLRPLTVDYLVVAGGGGGGGYQEWGGGGGAGGVRCTVGSTGGGGSLESALSLSLSTNYTVTVGAGGAGKTVRGSGNNGSNSVFASITSTGGGGGGGETRSPETANAAGTGGSGGGGAVLTNSGWAGTSTGAIASPSDQGYAGGNGYNYTTAGDSYNYSKGGGGGGAGAVGQNGARGTPSASPAAPAGNGGDGITTSISGSSVTYGGGGGAGAYFTTILSSGGNGGGGNGGNSTTNGANGTANRGSGGGGNGTSTTGAGGSGIVIVRYPV